MFFVYYFFVCFLDYAQDLTINMKSHLRPCHVWSYKKTVRYDNKKTTSRSSSSSCRFSSSYDTMFNGSLKPTTKEQSHLFMPYDPFFRGRLETPIKPKAFLAFNWKWQCCCLHWWSRASFKSLHWMATYVEHGPLEGMTCKNILKNLHR